MEQKTLPIQGKRTRNLAFEVIRVFAIFFVVFGHTEYSGYFLFSRYPADSIRFWLYMIPAACCHVTVPLFYAISGALLLGRKEESLTDLWRKRVVKYIIILLVVTSFYYFESEGFLLEELNIKTYLIILYAYNIGNMTWFLYSYLAYLMLLPFLKTLAQNLKTEYFHYLFALVLIFDILAPAAEYILWQGTVTMNSFFTIGWLFDVAVLFPLVGYYMEHRMDHRNKKKTLLVLWLVSAVLLVLSCSMTYYVGVVEGEYAENVAERFLRCSMHSLCGAVYLSIKYGMEKIRMPMWLEKVVISGGTCSFGVFILHMHVLYVDSSVRVQSALLHTGMDPMVAALLFCSYVMAVCWAATSVLRKIPVVKYIF